MQVISTERNPNAKAKLENIVRPLIYQQVKELDLLRFQRPSQNDLTFDFRIYDDYLKEYNKGRNTQNWFINNPDSNEYVNFFVQHIDYLINPAVVKKNS